MGGGKGSRGKLPALAPVPGQPEQKKGLSNAMFHVPVRYVATVFAHRIPPPLPLTHTCMHAELESGPYSREMLATQGLSYIG